MNTEKEQLMRKHAEVYARYRLLSEEVESRIADIVRCSHGQFRFQDADSVRVTYLQDAIYKKELAFEHLLELKGKIREQKRLCENAESSST